MKKLNNVFCLLIAAILISSCSQKEIDRTQFLPSNTTVAVKFNASRYLKDTFDDYLLNGKDIFSDLTKGVAGLLVAPDQVGIENLTNHYLFVEDLTNGEKASGAIVALSDGRKLTEYLTSQKYDVQESEGIHTAMINESSGLVWNNRTLLIKTFSQAHLFSVDKMKSAFSTSDWISHAKMRSVMAVDDFKNSSSHFSLLVSQSSDFSILETIPFIKKHLYLLNSITKTKGSKLIEIDIESAQINVKQKSYLTKQQYSSKKAQVKTNSVTDNLLFVPSSEPEMWVSASLSEKAMLSAIIENEELSSLFRDNLSAFLSVEEICSYLSGDVFFSDNGIEVSQKMIFESSFNHDTGEYESGEVSKAVEQKYYTLALGLKNGAEFNEKIKPLSMFLNLRNGVYNFNETYYFQVKENVIYISSSPASEKVFSGNRGELSLENVSLAKKHAIALVINMNSEDDLLIKGMKKLVIQKMDVQPDFETIHCSLTFEEKTNAVIELTTGLVAFFDQY